QVERGGVRLREGEGGGGGTGEPAGAGPPPPGVDAADAEDGVRKGLPLPARLPRTLGGPAVLARCPAGEPLLRAERERRRGTAAAAAGRASGAGANGGAGQGVRGAGRRGCASSGASPRVGGELRSRDGGRRPA